MWTISDATSTANTLLSDAGTFLTFYIPLIVEGALALVAVGFAWRHFKRYIGGRKF